MVHEKYVQTDWTKWETEWAKGQRRVGTHPSGEVWSPLEEHVYQELACELGDSEGI